jgi:RNA polymerase sigma factor (sigma-70 family)
MNDEYSSGAGDDPVDPRLAWTEHRAAMVAACRRILRDKSDAEDAANQAIEKVLADPPQEAPDDWKAWLCRTAQFAAMDIRRRKKKEKEFSTLVDGILPDRFRHVELHLDTQRLLARICEFLTDAKRQDFALLCDVEMKLITQKELAEILGMPRQRLKSRLKRVRKVAQEAAVAVCLVDGHGIDRCDELRRLAGAGKGSPSLLKVIKKHAEEECGGSCEKIWHNPSRLLRNVLVVPGLGLMAGLLAKFLRATTGRKAATAAVATVAGTSLVVALFTGGPDTTRSEVMTVPWTSTPRSTELTALPPPPPAEPPAPPAQVEAVPEPHPEPPALPQVSEPSSPPPSPITSAAADGGSRDDSRPAVTNGWLEHRRIVTARHGTCGDEPTTSNVRATITAPGGVSSATVYLRNAAGVIPFRMSNTAGSPTWQTQAGPITGKDAEGGYEVIVEAVGANGARNVTKIGKVCVSRCRASRPDGGAR